MTKYYTMKEAIDIMKPGDLFLPKEECYADIEMNNATVMLCIKDKMPINMSRANLSIIGQIKRAEPKILNVTNYLREKYGIRTYRSNTTNDFNEFDMQTAFVDGNKNGQLREWLRSEQVELRKAVNRVIEWSDTGALYKMKMALNNLKPPTEVG